MSYDSDLSRLGLIVRIALITLVSFQALTAATLAWASPHVPTEQEAKKEASGSDYRPDGRGYQAHSADSFTSKTRRAAAWVRERLASLHVTPARLCIGLGSIGIAVSWSRNKKLVKWAVITAFSLILLVFGVAAMIFDWPYMN